jgi:DNA-directed RNA polymerase subunit RPC12/RpoP
LEIQAKPGYLATRPQLSDYLRLRGKKVIVKCLECGNTFKVEKLTDSELVRCPICEAQYKLLIENGRAKLQEFIYENEDAGELNQ